MKKHWGDDSKNAQMKPLAKKYRYFADMGDFEGFVDAYPCRSEQSQISSTPVLFSDLVR